MSLSYLGTAEVRWVYPLICGEDTISRTEQPIESEQVTASSLGGVDSSGRYFLMEFLRHGWRCIVSMAPKPGSARSHFLVINLD
jgi:hypothetical protein